MREVELKAVIDDLKVRRGKLEDGGAILVYEGRLLDRRYDSSDRKLSAADNVLRVRRFSGRDGEKTLLDWKGPTSIDDGFKVREELSTGVHDHAVLATVLEKLGYLVTLEIDRDIAQYEIAGATVRFETYPRMDVLVEVEGEKRAIEAAIHTLDMSRAEFTSERLAAFVERFERRTGVRAAISDRELSGDYAFQGGNR
ncbi:MAG: class IV adenylate cyclase [Gemmatimonadaceae bacterium]|nr:class IV adenylate cyclase [Gemmatimonadaceae bacterium]